MALAKAIENNFTFEEVKKSDSRVVFSSFGTCNQKFKKIIDKYEEDFLWKTQRHGSIAPMVAGFKASETVRKSKFEEI